jgi:putative hydrolase of the HAD superfamily
MAIRAVFFDIGGVLEQNPRTGWLDAWTARLGLAPGALAERLGDLFRAGSVGQIAEADVEREVASRLGLDQAQLAAFMADLWHEYLGTLNAELSAYFSALRPRYRTGIVSNSFVGAREREQALYHFDALCDVIVYSHEVGIEKPTSRIFELACAQLGVQPSEAIFLDDHPPHVAAARSLGMQAIVFETTAQAIGAIEALLPPAP